MSFTVYLQRFHEGADVPVPFASLIAFLSQYGTPGNDAFAGEFVFPDELADDASVIGNDEQGASCIAFHRPVIDDRFKRLVLSAMTQFGLSAYDDGCEWLFMPPGESGHAPAAMLEELANGTREVHGLDDLWP